LTSQHSPIQETSCVAWISEINHCVQWSCHCTLLAKWTRITHYCVQRSSHWTCSQCAKWICVSHNRFTIALPFGSEQNKCESKSTTSYRFCFILVLYNCLYMLYLPFTHTPMTNAPLPISFKFSAIWEWDTRFGTWNVKEPL